VKKAQARAREKAKATSDPPRRIIADEVGLLSEQASSQLGTNRNLAAIINRKRRKEKSAPQAPRTRFGFEIPDTYTTLSNGETFLLADSGSEDEDRILIFGAPSMISLMTR
jgi:hypothetical protein